MQFRNNHSPCSKKRKPPNFWQSLSQILTDFQNSFTAEKRTNIFKKLHNIFHHTLSMFLHYFGKVSSSNLLQITIEKIRERVVFDKNETFMLSYG